MSTTAPNNAIAERDGTAIPPSETYIIEVADQAAGIVVRDKSGYRFFAAAPKFSPLEGRIFRSAREAEKAAAQQLVRRQDEVVA